MRSSRVASKSVQKRKQTRTKQKYQPPAGGQSAQQEQTAQIPQDVLFSILDPDTMNETEQQAVWTLLLYLKKQENMEE
jgi:hypothetical protein